MGLAKEGYANANIGTTAVKIAVDENGYIVADSGTTVAGTKTFQFNRVAAENNLQDNTDVLEFVFGLIGNVQYSETSNTMQVKWEVEE